ncbi:MAG TPA: phosphoenolpyruvate carboxykinase (ATP) [Thermomicrobiales bacterium]|nr:phosphoenolpyruvate carboxykinase (ATP) [Thermomicrobiales bacterium]
MSRNDRPAEPLIPTESPRILANLENHDLVNAAILHHEGRLTATGAIAVSTGAFTGRSPRDKYVVEEPVSQDDVWWGAVNHPMTPDTFDRLHRDVEAYLDNELTYTQQLAVGADPAFQYPVDLRTQRAWVALFSRHLFIVPETPPEAEPITILHAPGFQPDPDTYSTRSSTVIALHLTKRIILIAGTEYAGEVKKSVFTIMQYLLPKQDVATMHCSANVNAHGETTLFFGLSGTGKTTLSNDPAARLVGDDEHGWSNNGVFNLEGGCYAKTIKLSEADEPRIYAATRVTGTVLENVPVDDASDYPDFDDDSLTENTRAAFSLEALPNCIPSGTAPHAKHIVLLTADASGVLPPVSRLTREQALALYLLGFTSKVAGTERGLTEPEPTFSECFGAPFLPLPPERYAELLGQKIDQHAPTLWLVNTGWTGGPYGTGKRISIAHTRAIITAVTNGSLNVIPTAQHPVFGLAVPTFCPGVPDATLDPKQTWDDPAAYDAAAIALRDTFRQRAASQGIPDALTAWLG